MFAYVDSKLRVVPVQVPLGKEKNFKFCLLISLHGRRKRFRSNLHESRQIAKHHTCQNFLVLSLKEFPIKNTSLKAIDKAAIIGLSKPAAAIGIAITL